MTAYAPPMCMVCAHLRDGLDCDAYPDGIPDPILEGEADHRLPFAGDRGLRFEPDPGKPVDLVGRIVAEFDAPPLNA